MSRCLLPIAEYHSRNDSQFISPRRAMTTHYMAAAPICRVPYLVFNCDQWLADAFVNDDIKTRHITGLNPVYPRKMLIIQVPKIATANRHATFLPITTPAKSLIWQEADSSLDYMYRFSPCQAAELRLYHHFAEVNASSLFLFQF